MTRAAKDTEQELEQRIQELEQRTLRSRHKEAMPLVWIY